MGGLDEAIARRNLDILNGCCRSATGTPQHRDEASHRSHATVNFNVRARPLCMQQGDDLCCVPPIHAALPSGRQLRVRHLDGPSALLPWLVTVATGDRPTLVLAKAHCLEAPRIACTTPPWTGVWDALREKLWRGHTGCPLSSLHGGVVHCQDTLVPAVWYATMSNAGLMQ